MEMTFEEQIEHIQALIYSAFAITKDLIWQKSGTSTAVQVVEENAEDVRFRIVLVKENSGAANVMPD